MSDDDLVFVLQPPRIDSKNISQLRNAAAASAARQIGLNRRWCFLMSEDKPPTALNPANKSAVPDAHAEEVLNASAKAPNLPTTQNSATPVTPDAEVPIATRPASPGTTTRSSAIMTGRNFQSGGRSRYTSMASRAPVARVSDAQPHLRILQKGISAAEINSGMPLQAPREDHPKGRSIYDILAHLWYSLDLELWGDETTHKDLEPWMGHIIRLAADTADSAFWFYGEDFRELEFINANRTEYITFSWEKPYSHGIRMALPMGPADERAEPEPRLIGYGDEGGVSVFRWTDEMPFFVPSWSWKLNNKSRRSHMLKFPRVLAEAATRVTASQTVDGNLGLAVPGRRAPWKGAEPSDRLTFFDILNQVPAERTVEAPAALLIRFLKPDNTKETYAPVTTQSFLYYGSGLPCAIPQSNGPYLLPQFGPPLQILPKPPQYPPREDGPTPPPVFGFWALHFLSMTLLEPVGHDPNHDVLDEANWVQKTIRIARIRGGTGGLPVVFDSGSTASCLPESVLFEMWTAWFGGDDDEYLNDVQGDVLWHSRDFSKHDILFEFKDNAGQIFTLRCSAEDFLSSPWHTESEPARTYSLFQAPEDETDTTLWVLGVNFFWVAMLKLKAEHRGHRPSSTSNPTMQLAPQRVVQDGRKVGEAYDLEFLKDMPPRLASRVLGQPELCPPPV